MKCKAIIEREKSVCVRVCMRDREGRERDREIPSPRDFLHSLKVWTFSLRDIEAKKNFVPRSLSLGQFFLLFSF